MNKKQDGFSIVEVLILLVIVTLIGGTGWYIWQQNKSEDTGQTAQTSNELPTDPPVSYEGWKTYKDDNQSLSFHYPEAWIEDASQTWLSELPVMDEKSVDSPRAKNIYFQMQLSYSDTPGAGLRFMAGPNQGQLMDPRPTVFKEVRLESGQQAFIYKQFSGEDEKESPESYFLANKDMNHLKLKDSDRYLVFIGHFNAKQGDYSVIAPLKKNGSFIPDERQEVLDFVNVVKSLEI